VIVLGALLTAGVEAASASETTWKTSFDSGVKARREAQYVDAERLLRSAVAQAEAFGPQDDRLVRSLNELGTILRFANKLGEAQPVHERALGIAEGANGKNSPDVATSLYGLAVVASRQGRAKDAEPLFKRALAIRENRLGPNAPEVAYCLYGYARFRMDQEDLGARALLLRALRILENNSGEEPEYLPLVLLSLGEVYEYQDQLAEAWAAYGRALKEGVRVLSEDDPILVEIDLVQADFKLFHQNDIPGAITLYERAIPLVAREEGIDLEQLAAYKINLATAYFAQERYVDAERVYGESLPILQKSAEPGHWNLADAITKYEESKKHNATHASGTASKYETRYVNGTMFQIGTQGDLEVSMALSLEPEGWGTSGQLDAMVYVVNDSERPVTFFPEKVVVEAVKQTEDGPKIERIKTFSAEQYEQKVRNHNIGTQFLATDFSHLNDSQGSTSRTQGNYDVKDSYGRNVGSISYSGTTTREPTAAEKQAALDRAQAKREALRDQLDASYQSMAQTLMRTHTLDAHTYYGGMVYMNQRGKKVYVVTVPFGEKNFQFSFSFK
jgi:tetratricopeptide (TPR) repeat protein